MRHGVLISFAAIWLSGCQVTANEPTKLRKAVPDIDRSTPGELGVYVKNLGSGEEFSYQATRPWYIASLVKIPVAIAVLQAVEEGELSLNDTIALSQDDYVDGAGELLYHDPGTTFTIAELLEHSIENSDSTATDMLMRAVGVDEVNRRISNNMVERGFHPLTTILQVRFDAYGELHPTADALSNIDYVEIRSAGEHAARVRAFQRKLDLREQQLQVAELEQAFARYYQRQLNSATLPALGLLLERLVKGELLNQQHTQRLLNHMQNITTGEQRLQAGLPDTTPFAQKTGTQVQRACNMGVTYPYAPNRATVIVVCAEQFDELEQAERAFQSLAQAISASPIYAPSDASVSSQ